MKGTSLLVRHYPKGKYTMANGRHLENRYDVIFPQWMFQFGSRMQNNTPITAKWSRSKPEVEFQYGGRLFFKTGSSYISAANWNVSTKFGVRIDFAFLKAVTSTNTKPEVVFSGRRKPELELSSRGRHFEKSIWCQIFALGGPMWMKFDNFMQNFMRITVMWSK